MSTPAELAPGRPTQPRAARSKDQSGRPLLAGIRVLVVEDDSSNQKLLALLLTQAGAAVTATASAEEALVAIGQSRPRLIVLDLVLPRMGGLVLAEQLQADPLTRDIVLVAVTALNGAEGERMALQAGCSGYLRKPIDTETFTATLARHLKEER